MKRHLTLTLLLFLTIFGGVGAQKKVLYGIAFYNVENLFDTTHDAGRNDYEFLPTGSYKWTEQKYQAKLQNISQVLSELCTEVGKAKNPAGAAVIGLSEVENRHVLDDLLRQPSLSARGYEIVHIDGPDRRGVDCALLYNPKAFKLERTMLVPYIYRDTNQPSVDLGFYTDAQGQVQPYPYERGKLVGDTTYITRGFLTVSGRLGGEKFHFIVNHWPSRGAQSATRELNDDPGDASVTAPEALAAKTEAKDCAPTDFFDPWYDMLYNKGTGTLYYNGKWNLFDQIIFTGNLFHTPKDRLHYYTHAVFTRDYLFQTEGRYKGAPQRTTAGGTWLNGYSDHLPTQLFLINEAK